MIRILRTFVASLTEHHISHTVATPRRRAIHAASIRFRIRIEETIVTRLPRLDKPIATERTEAERITTIIRILISIITFLIRIENRVTTIGEATVCPARIGCYV
ncbi:hypothetical protein A2635_04315 [Candidatus Peribacteria bacterium RIFCSPHIGHO2_01_FULL_51_9]|nr:MAG: hypothetical protein A2635_04315 [Candidatus Peribacteria bacterium RIFCSPHIGHO2_01_FULL_51_9]